MNNNLEIVTEIFIKKLCNENKKRQYELLEQASYEFQQKRIKSNNLDAGEPYYSKKSKSQKKQKYSYEKR